MSTVNTLKTGLLLAALTALLGAAGFLVGGGAGVVSALTIALLVNCTAYWFSDRLVLSALHAEPVTAGEAPELFAAVREMADDARVPVPRLYIVRDPSPNAFALGRNHHHAAIGVTTGLLDLLDAKEVRAVLAHEFAHIKHRDILLATVVVTVAGAFTALPALFHFSVLFGQHDEDEGPGVLGMLGMVILAPLAASVIQLAVWHAREFAADATAAQLCREPLTLAEALRKLGRGTWLHPMAINPARTPLFTVHPLAGGAIAGWFQTHPPLAVRITRLAAMAADMTGEVPPTNPSRPTK